MKNISFKERVKNVAIDGARLYKENFIDCEYLICSKAFHEKKYYIAKADKGNYLHLIGVHTKLTPVEFFDKCYEGELTEDDFDFKKMNQKEKDVKGTVRQKIKVLPDMMCMYDKALVAQEHFKKNKVECAFATADYTHTLGYVSAGRPKSLLQKNELDKDKLEKVDLVFRKPRGVKKYSKLLSGDEEKIDEYIEKIGMMLTEALLKRDEENKMPSINQ